MLLKFNLTHPNESQKGKITTNSIKFSRGKDGVDKEKKSQKAKLKWLKFIFNNLYIMKPTK